jgi:hypothetical protein
VLNVRARCARVTVTPSRGGPGVKTWLPADVSAVLLAGGTVGDPPGLRLEERHARRTSPIRMGIVLNARASKLDDGRVQ